MGNQLRTLQDIHELTYLNVNNPWRWKDNIKNILNTSSQEKFFQIYYEICITYAITSNVNLKVFEKYFEEIFERRIIEPEIEIRKFGEKGEGMADSFFEKRKEIHNENLCDIRKIYVLWKEIGIKKGFSISFYPNDLNEIFE